MSACQELDLAEHLQSRCASCGDGHSAPPWAGHRRAVSVSFYPFAVCVSQMLSGVIGASRGWPSDGCQPSDPRCLPGLRSLTETAPGPDCCLPGTPAARDKEVVTEANCPKLSACELFKLYSMKTGS